jgi:DNA-binding MarR family transcriptional regulator
MEDNKKKQSLDFSVKAAWLAIAKMYNALGADHHVTHSIGYVLLNIDKEHGTPATKIAPLMGMEARSLSRMLKMMEDEQMIYRQIDKKDKRKVLVCLTEKGKEKREFARQVVKEFNRKVKEQLTPEQLAHFFQVIEKINEVAEAYKLPQQEEVYYENMVLAHK